MIWKTNFANAENFEDSKENISTLNVSKEYLAAGKTDMSRIVDARKSTIFQRDDDSEVNS
jgi:hypothetical protein